MIVNNENYDRIMRLIGFTMDRIEFLENDLEKLVEAVEKYEKVLKTT